MTDASLHWFRNFDDAMAGSTLIGVLIRMLTVAILCCGFDGNIEYYFVEKLADKLER